MPLQLQDQTHWLKVFDQTFRADSPTPYRFTPIPSFIIGRSFSAHILVIATESEDARPNWWFACQVQMIVEAIGTDFDRMGVDRLKLALNQGQLCQFPKISDQYRLRIDIPKWHKSLRISIWEYIGPEYEATDEALASIRDDLQRLENKINSLL